MSFGQSPTEVLIDKGEVHVTFKAIQEPTQITYKVPPECGGTKVEISKHGGTVRIVHRGPCKQGARFDLIVNSSVSSVVQLEAGMLVTENLGSIAAELSHAEATVTAGHLSSTVKVLRVSPINYNAGAEATASPAVTGPTVKLTVAAGYLQLN